MTTTGARIAGCLSNGPAAFVFAVAFFIYGQPIGTESTMCNLTSVEFRAANVLDVEWSLPERQDSDDMDCQFRLYDVTNGGDASAICQIDGSIVERRVAVTNRRFSIWNATKPGSTYVVCLRIIAREHQNEMPWSTRVVQIKLRQPPVIRDSCTILIGNKTKSSRLVGEMETYFYTIGNKVEMICHVDGWPTPIVRWCKNGPFQCRNVSASNPHLSIINASASDAGFYIMFAENEHGRVESRGFQIRLPELESLPGTTTTVSLVSGSYHPLSCQTAGGTSIPLARYSWNAETEPDRKRGQFKLNERTVLGTDGTLLFMDIQTSDARTYDCQAENEEMGEAKYGAFVKVEVKPPPEDSVRLSAPEIFTSASFQRSVWAQTGTRAKLHCLFSGRPRPTITWSRNGKPLPNDARFKWLPGNHTLEITRVSVDDRGRYQCNASNSVGYVKQLLDVDLNVIDLPKLIEFPVSVNASVGDASTFHCRAAGGPTINIHWYFNGVDITSRSKIEPTSNKIYQAASRLTLNDINTNDSGSVCCNASTSYGYAVGTAYHNVFVRTKLVDSTPDISTTATADHSDQLQTTVRVNCSGSTDILTNLRVEWTLQDMSSPEAVQSWHVNETGSLIINFLGEFDLKHDEINWSSSECVRAECVASNGLTDDRRAVVMCRLNEEPTVMEHRDDISLNVWLPWTIVIMLVACAIIFFAVILKRGNGSKCPDVHQRHPHRVPLMTQTSVVSNTGTTSSSQTGGSRLISPSDSIDCMVCENGCAMSGMLSLNDTMRSKLSDMFISRDRLVIGETIGKGQFGRVLSAELLSNRNFHLREHVAVKTMKFRAEESEMVELFLREAVIMRDFRHQNVLHIVGVSFEVDGSPMVVLPYMANGDLRKYILNPDMDITILELLKMGIQVANGMQYLSGLRFVHRDLAARNCMVNDRCIVKVADFGLSRQLLQQNYYRADGGVATPVPIRWLAPECLENNLFTTKSDVWSFGVLLWELMTRGAVPYSEVENWQIVNYVESGNRLSQPQYCPDSIFSTMLKCWSEDPAQRPTFEELVRSIDDVILSAKPGTRISSVLYQNISGRDKSSTASFTGRMNSTSGSPPSSPMSNHSGHSVQTFSFRSPSVSATEI